MGGRPTSVAKMGYCRPDRSQLSMIIAVSDSR
jgi:hypothetical protein